MFCFIVYLLWYSSFHMEEEFKIGDLVMWCKSTYFIVDIVEGGAMLKQNFSIGSHLISPVPLNELKKIK